MINKIMESVVKNRAKSSLMSRNRAYCDPSRGRLTGEDINYINQLTAQNFKELIANAPKSKSFVNNVWMKSAVITLALYRAVDDLIDDSEYAKELTCDVMWKVFMVEVKPLIIITRMLRRERQKQLNFALLLSFKYFFRPKEFKIDLRSTQDCMYVSLKTCWMLDYFKQVGNEDEMDFFRRSWCAFDTDFINVIVKGKTHYERPQALSTGGTECDMRWRAV